MKDEKLSPVKDVSNSNIGSKRYPCVLIIAKSRINDIDSQGASIRNWFHDWPKERVAQIYSGGEDIGTGFCGREYHISSADRRLGSLFMLFKRKTMAEVGNANLGAGTNANSNPLRDMARKIVASILRSGIWELVFSIRISAALLRWVKDYSPDVIYSQASDISFMLLPLVFNGTLGIPYAIQIADDWPKHLYGGRPIPWAHAVMARTFRRYVAKATKRFSTSLTMSTEYQERYNAEFIPLMNCDDSMRFRDPEPRVESQSPAFWIVYSGSLLLNRWKAFITLNSALDLLRREGVEAMAKVYVTSIPPEGDRALSSARYISLEPALRDQEVPSALVAADLLFLPEAFDGEHREFIKYSISTKAHLYMMSQRPTLVFGPPEVAVVKYAKAKGWGLVVDEDNPLKLHDAILLLMEDREYIVWQAARQRETYEANHEATTVRESMRLHLIECGSRATPRVRDGYGNEVRQSEGGEGL